MEMPARKATLLGMPAVQPPRPPSMEPPRPPSMEPPKPPSMEAPKRNPDATQQVALADILEEGAVAKPRASAPPPPPRMSSAPPVPPAAAKKADTTQQLDALDLVEEEAPSAETTGGFEVLAEPSAELEEAPRANVADVAPAAVAAVGAASVQAAPVAAAPAFEAAGDLDYDDLAETVAREAPSALAPMAPRVDADPAPHVAPHVEAQPEPAPRRDATPVIQHDRVSHTPTMTAVTEPPNRNGLYALAGGALVFLSVVLFIAYQAFGKPEPVANVAPMPAPTLVGDAPTQATEPVASAQVAEPAPVVAPTVEPVVAEPAVEEPAVEEVAAEEPAAEEPVEAEVAEAAEPEEPAVEEEADEPSARPGRRRARGRATRPARSGGSAFDQAREAAREAFQARNFAAAEQAYVRATTLNGRHAGSWAGLGAARMQTRNFPGAVQAYQRAVQLQSSNSGYFTMLGHALRMTGNSGGARQAYQRAVALDPANRAAQQALSSL
jgi:hypothetical protein